MLTIGCCNVILLEYNLLLRTEEVTYLEKTKIRIKLFSPIHDLSFYLLIDKQKSYFCFFEEESLIVKVLGGFESSKLLHYTRDEISHFEYIVNIYSKSNDFTTLCEMIKDKQDILKNIALVVNLYYSECKTIPHNSKI
jgi:hypothetical protein